MRSTAFLVDSALAVFPSTIVLCAHQLGLCHLPARFVVHFHRGRFQHLGRTRVIGILHDLDFRSRVHVVFDLSDQRSHSDIIHLYIVDIVDGRADQLVRCDRGGRLR